MATNVSIPIFPTSSAVPHATAVPHVAATAVLQYR